MRLQTFLAHAGVTSRRAAETVIKSGRVSVNGRTVLERAFPVNPGRDEVSLDGKAVSVSAKEYYVMNKPKGVTSSVRDAHALRTVIDLLGPTSGRVYPVGRLDKETTGVLLLTNDGDLAYRLTHPRFGVKKVYRATVKGALREGRLREVERGIALEEGLTAPCRIKVVSRREGLAICEIELHEGRKRQIRRMFEAIGYRVIELVRTTFAGIRLGKMREGEVRRLTDGEIRSLKKL